MKQRERSGRVVEITFQIPVEIAPALRSVIEERSYKVGERIEKGSYSFPREQALTDGAEAMGVLRAAVTKAIPQGDKYYAK